MGDHDYGFLGFRLEMEEIQEPPDYPSSPPSHVSEYLGCDSLTTSKTVAGVGGGYGGAGTGE